MIRRARTATGIVGCVLAAASTLAPRRAATQSSARGAAPSPTTVKGGVSTLLGIPHVGRERPLRAPGRSFQWDVMLSPWRSVEGYPFQFLVGAAEWRWYRRPDRSGWYAAVHAGAVAFRLRRPDYRDTTLYQEGAGVLGGATVGYQLRRPGGWALDLYAGGGTVQSLYKGYDRLTGSRYDGAKLWNVSGEFYPYRVGAMLGRTRR